MITNQDGLQSIVDQSFQQFLYYSCILENDSFNHMIMDAPESYPVNISLGCYRDPCRWLISLNRNSQGTLKPHLRRYFLIVEYMIDAVLSYENCYVLTKDIKRNQLVYYRQNTRIVERIKDSHTNLYLVSEGKESDGVGIHPIYNPE